MRTTTPGWKMAVMVAAWAAFLAGGYWYTTQPMAKLADAEGMEDGSDATATAAAAGGSEAPACYDTLIQDGISLKMYNSKNHEQPPKTFNNLEEYGRYLETSDKRCPVLFLRKETNAQGDDVYRLMQPYDGAVVPVLDASRDNGFNQNILPGFDPYGLHVGRVTAVDQTHASTEAGAPWSDNPMDPNWGGVEYTQRQIAAGKYAGNEVTRPRYPTAKAEMARALYFGGDPRMPDSLKAVETRDSHRQG